MTTNRSTGSAEQQSKTLWSFRRGAKRTCGSSQQLFLRKSFNWLSMGVRKTNCRGRLARSGTVAGSLPQLANTLTIRELQNREQRSSINSSPVKKVTYLFGLPLISLENPTQFSFV